tara:strand:+ start:87 stop:278 length:192 start_codon:yes stop_codon:yes gene_type:complete
MTQGSIGTAGYVRLYDNKAYARDYYHRNKEKIKKQNKRRKEAKKRFIEFKKKQDELIEVNGTR